MTEGAPGPRPHRCNDRVEDAISVRAPAQQRQDETDGRNGRKRHTVRSLADAVLSQGLFEGAPRENFLPLLRLARLCLQSAPGQEPADPYRFAQPQAPPLAHARTQPARRGRAGEVAAPSPAAPKTDVPNPAADLRRAGWRGLWPGKGT